MPRRFSPNTNGPQNVQLNGSRVSVIRSSPEAPSTPADFGDAPTAEISLDGHPVKTRFGSRPIRRTICCKLNYGPMVQEGSVRVERRLSAILAADVAGYSRLMHSDEEATHAKLTALLADAVAPAIAEHGGRIVKNTGDGFLAEFPSAVEAVRAAMQFQTRIKELATDAPEDRRIAFRVGINIGDVIAEPNDIFGDGVNIAARLESICRPRRHLHILCCLRSSPRQGRG
jgi:class 3 adenylate cyclase